MQCSYKRFPRNCYSWAAVDNDEKIKFGQVTSRKISHIFSESLPSTMGFRKIPVFFLSTFSPPQNMHDTQGTEVMLPRERLRYLQSLRASL